MNIKENMLRCVEILKKFDIITPKKSEELCKRVNEEDTNAYGEISVFLEEIISIAKEV